MSPITTLSNLRRLDFPKIGPDQAWLSVYEGNTHVPFAIARVFAIFTADPCTRGRHAHRECVQLLVPMAGTIRILVKDGRSVEEIVLPRGCEGLLVPPGLWVEICFEDDGGVLMVLCDLPYQEDDYLRSWDEFLTFKGLA